jgi:hypothetical protein
LIAHLRKWLDRHWRIGHRRFQLTGEGFVDQRGIVRWTDVVRVDAFRRHTFLGTVVSIAITSRDGSTCYIDERDLLWLYALDAIDRHLPPGLPKDRWLHDLASGRRDFVKIYGQSRESNASPPSTR